MVTPSTLRQGGYIPYHGSKWGEWFYNWRIGKEDPIPTKDRVSKHCSSSFNCNNPEWWWSCDHISRLLHGILREPKDESTQLHPCLDYLLPVPNISETHDLFALLHEDFFGIVGSSGSQQWIFDSGASSHCCHDLSMFTSMSQDLPFKRIKVANGKFANISGIGTIKLSILDHKSNTVVKLVLHNVLYIPEVPVNLISSRCLWNDSGIRSSFTDVCDLTLKNGTTISFKGQGKLYYCTAKSDHDSRPTLTKSMAAFIDDFNVPSLPNHDSIFTSSHASEITADIVHARLGHCGPDRATNAISGSIGIPQIPHFRKQLQPHCESCRLGGARKHPFFHGDNTHRPRTFGERIHSDLCGEFPISITGNFKYILSFVDAATGFSEIYFLQSKSADEVKSYFEKFQTKWKHKLPNGHVTEWFTDNGGEFISNDLHEFCEEFAVKRGFTVPYCSPTNGQAERLWGILQRSMRIMLAHSGLPVNFWHYAAAHANMLHNLLPRHSNTNHISPYEAMEGNKPDFSRVRVWGCLTYCTLRNDADIPTRVSPTGVKAIHLGADGKRNGWIVYIPSLNRITTIRDITFNEHKFLRFDSSGRIIEDTERFVDDGPIPMDVTRAYNDPLQTKWRGPPMPHGPTPIQHAPAPLPVPTRMDTRETVGPGWNHPDATDTHFSDKQCSNPQCTISSVDGLHDGPHSFERIGGTRQRPQPGAFLFHVPADVNLQEDDDPASIWAIHAEKFGSITIPNNYDEAMASKLSHKWKEAMEREIRELLGRQTWEPVDLPHGRRCTKSRWVYAIKYHSDGSVDRFKARFVVCGYSQIHGVDYDEAFSSTMRGTTFRLLLALAAQHQLKADHIDISNAFCQAEIDDVEIIIQPPRGFEALCGSSQGLKLLKALYGTKQAGRLWQQTLAKWLEQNGFTRLHTDPCVFVKNVGNHKIILGVYVDDILVLHDPKSGLFDAFLRDFLQCNGGRFDGKHIGALEWFLGIKVDRHANGDYSINQSKYIKDLLDRFIPNSEAIAYSRRTPYPAEKFKELREASTDEEIEKVKRVPYLSIVGALLYLSTMSRPDIAYHMSVLCSFMQNPSMQCYEAAQSLLLYVGKTRNLCIRYTRNFGVPDSLANHVENIRNKGGLHAFCDSTWTVPKSTCGYSVFMSGGPIAWMSRKLNLVADSTALAEYSCASSCSKELSFIRFMLRDLGYPLDGPIAIGVDNTAAITITTKLGVTKLTKHFDFAVHRIRDEAEHQRIIIQHVETFYQTADVFTKALDDTTFLRHRNAFFT